MSARREVWACVLAATLVAACGGGSVLEGTVTHPGPAGLTATVTAARLQFRGELLAASDSGVLMLRAGRLTFVPRSTLREIWTTRLAINVTASSFGGEPLKRLSNSSRYPQGVSGSLLQSLLAAYKQDTVDVVSR